uniref:WGS project CBMI000000000 data, contig CS3069_c003937 n=1 Tax=Fusarium clavum TaxID=2594811 RepID=A0A090MIC3_9HYPO|nr:unnamed protein product [Fusarium clavum]
MYYWWKNPARVEGVSGHQEDDWVFTAGGYHPSFVVPAHYPNPERLSISWSWNNTVSILGEAYFAITPKACMGGGHLRATLSLGPLSAFFDATVDFLINYDPFFFQGESRISVGVRYDMDLWLVHLHINIQIGAVLHIQGPPMSGFVHVDFWVFGFDIAFGGEPNKDKDKILLLDEFYRLVLQTGTGPKAVSGPDPLTTPNTAHIFSGETGILAPAKASTPTSSTAWRVQGGFFSFSLTCRFPTNHLAFGDEKDAKETQGTDPLFAKAMHGMQALNVVLTVKIQKRITDSKGNVHLEHDISHAWSWAQTMKSAPGAVWGLYDESKDPSKSVRQVKDLLNESSGKSSLVASGYRLAVPPSKPSTEVIPAFNTLEAMRYKVPGNQFPSFESASEAWEPRATQPDSDEAGTAYEEVRKGWKKVDQKQVEIGINLWTSALGWGELTGAKALSGATPEILTRDMEQLLVAPPLLGQDPVAQIFPVA